jgi:hypothetical protein
MPEFSLGDLVRVVRQPKDMKIQVVEKVGFINQLTPTQANVTGLKLDGSHAWYGTIQFDYLEYEISPQWIEAKRLRDEVLEKAWVESVARTERYNARMFELSVRYGISVEQVKALFSELNYLNRQGWWP